MRYYNMHFSPTGGTKKVAGILANALSTSWEEIDLCKAVTPLTLQPEDVCLVSVPSYGGRVPALALERLGCIKGSGAKAILVCVYGNREWDDTLTELQDSLEQLGFVCAAAVAAVAAHSIFRQFAAGRPDAQDEKELVAFAGKIREKLASGCFGDLNLAGSHGPYRKYGGVPFKPQGSKKCVSCGLCAKQCPTGAIDPAQPAKTDADKCISCMRCVALCPQKARDFNALVMKGAAAAMAPKLGGHKENHLFV